MPHHSHADRRREIMNETGSQWLESMIASAREPKDIALFHKTIKMTIVTVWAN